MKLEETLKSLHYQQYADHPMRKWQRQYNSHGIEHMLRIRETTESEQKCYHSSLIAKAKYKDNDLFGCSFTTFTGEDPAELDEKMKADVEQKAAEKK
jgi:hypothetical protein